MRSSQGDTLFFNGSLTYLPCCQLILGIIAMSFEAACVGRVSWGILETKVQRLLLFVSLVI